MRIPMTDVTDVGNLPGDGPLRAGGRPMPGTGPMNDRNLPSTPCPAVKRQTPALKIMRDIWCGNEKFQEAGEEYLPKGPGEDRANYKVRLRRAALFNVTKHTINGLVGFVFRTPPTLGDDVPVRIAGSEGESEEAETEGLWENIDNAGTHGDVFARDLMVDAMVAGHAAILVEFPKTGGMQSYGAEISGAVRPYWVPIKKDNILSWRTETRDGQLLLTQLVLKECVCVSVGMFGEAMVDRYRVLYNEAGVVGWELYSITDRKELVLEDAGLYPTQTEIPVAEIVTSGRQSLFESDPPFLDLAYLNLAHYRQWSDYDTSIYKTCVPILFTAGVLTSDEQGNAMIIGPNAAIGANDPAAKAEYVSHGGEALASCKQSLDDLENRMGALGLAALATSKRTAETAKAKEIDKGASDSALAVMARGLQDGIERALQFTAQYLGEADGGSIELNTEFQDMTMDAPTMAAWASLATALSLPAKVVLEALIAGGKLPEDTDIESLALEMEAAAQAEADRKAEEFQRTLDAKAKQPPAQGFAIQRGADGKAARLTKE